MKKNPFNKKSLALQHQCKRVDLDDVDHVDGANNTAGIGQYIYYCKESDIDVLPTVVQPDPTQSGSLEDLVTITDNIVMKPGKKFNKIYVTLETGKLDSESQGEIDGVSYLNKLEFLVPGSEDKTLGLQAYAKNASLIFIVPELDGKKRMLGYRAYPAKMISAPGTTGQKAADRKAVTFTFQSAGPIPSPIFKGQIKVSGVGSGYDYDSDGNQEIMYAD